jgi:hypothetical protein
MTRIFVKPAREGLIVRHPEKMKHVLAPEGEWVNRSNQWLRYIAHGDVIEVAPPEAQAVKAKRATKPAKQVKAVEEALPETNDKQLNGGE